MGIATEIEIKCLLGEKANADSFVQRLQSRYPDVQPTAATKQLNHYFIDGDMVCLKEKIASLLNEAQREKFNTIAGGNPQSLSIRTRETDSAVLLVVKASLGDDSSANGVVRMEFEEKINMTLDELDQVLLSCGFQYQAKWSRERVEYVLPSMTVTLDKNAGYGYLAEFEKVVDADHSATDVQKELLAAIAELGLEELPQDRLERMFAHYNANWRDYYGTENTFTIA